MSCEVRERLWKETEGIQEGSRRPVLKVCGKIQSKMFQETAGQQNNFK